MDDSQRLGILKFYETTFKTIRKDAGCAVDVQTVKRLYRGPVPDQPLPAIFLYILHDDSYTPPNQNSPSIHLEERMMDVVAECWMREKAPGKLEDELEFFAADVYRIGMADLQCGKRAAHVYFGAVEPCILDSDPSVMGFQVHFHVWYRHPRLDPTKPA